MSLDKSTDFGKISISNNAVASLVANAAMECYGVVGILNKKSLRESKSKLLDSSNFVNGVKVYSKSDVVGITLNIAVAYGVKVTEVLREVQKKVKYVVEQKLKIMVDEVNVYAVDLIKVE